MVLFSSLINLPFRVLAFGLFAGESTAVASLTKFWVLDSMERVPDFKAAEGEAVAAAAEAETDAADTATDAAASADVSGVGETLSSLGSCVMEEELGDGASLVFVFCFGFFVVVEILFCI